MARLVTSGGPHVFNGAPPSPTTTSFPITGVLSRNYFSRVYLTITSGPTGATMFPLDFYSGSNFSSVRANLDRTLTADTTINSNRGTTVLALALGTEYRLELRVRIATGTLDEYEMRAYVGDSPTIAEALGPFIAIAITDVAVSSFVIGTDSAATVDMSMREVAVNDDQGDADNSWLGPTVPPLPALLPPPMYLPMTPQVLTG